MSTRALNKTVLGGLAAIGLLLSIAPSLAQPAPVPALPDTERRTGYSITASVCNCAVGFALFGDSTDYTNWLEVFVNGVLIPQSGNWMISSPTGSLATIPRPITDAVLTFTAAQTGTIQIVGARRPRRTSQVTENRGVAARDFNQIITDVVATQRELWDKTNDVTGRAVLVPPGETLALLPVLASRANMGACFDSGGNLTSCVSVPSGTIAAGSGILFTGTNPTTISTNPATVPVLNGPNAWSGKNQFNGDVYFGSGRPWADVRAFGAQCNGSNDDTTAIQSAINTVGGGGIVYVPPGNCLITSTLNITGGVTIVGAGATATSISANTDINMINFSSAVGYGGFEKLSVFGKQTGAPTQPTVFVDTNALVIMRDCRIWGGQIALYTKGVDGLVENCFIAGAGTGATPQQGSIVSQGANWYVRVKVDTAGVPANTGFYQGTGALAGSMENHFVMSDFSGAYTNSIIIDDGGANTAITVFEGGVFSSPISIARAKWTAFNMAEFGAAISHATPAGGVLTIANSYAVGGAITVSGGSTNRRCSNNGTDIVC